MKVGRCKWAGNRAQWDEIGTVSGQDIGHNGTEVGRVDVGQFKCLGNGAQEVEVGLSMLTGSRALCGRNRTVVLIWYRE
jgi:hypothetical protein